MHHHLYFPKHSTSKHANANVNKSHHRTWGSSLARWSSQALLTLREGRQTKQVNHHLFERFSFTLVSSCLPEGRGCLLDPADQASQGVPEDPPAPSFPQNPPNQERPDNSGMVSVAI